MKYITLILLLIVTSCASRTKTQVTVRPMLVPAVEPAESVRHTETVRAYHIGRYVDPNHPDVMHDQHPIFRVEARSRWNLKPGNLCAPGAVLLNPPQDAAFSPTPASDAVAAEMNRQKEATERVMREASQLAQSYEELQKVIKDMSVVAKNHAWMGGRILSAERRVGEIEAELRKLNAPPALASNEVRSSTIEAPETPKP
jgi:Ni/Co efflux regulator RcnB